MSKEKAGATLSGWLVLPITIILTAGGIWVLTHYTTQTNAAGHTETMAWAVWVGFIALALGVLSMGGFFALQPNEARVLILFGNYRGTERTTGFRWGNPFFSNGSPAQADASQQTGGDNDGRKARRRGPGGRYKISLRARTLNGDKLKVNDKRGNPIDIAAVVVWRVADTAQAVFDVNDYNGYVTLQSETALRHLATEYSYDHGETGDEESTEITLRSNVDDVSKALRAELSERLAKAGVEVDEARLTHLAYAPEIAQAMLRRQQAEAVIAARRKIVQGATSMVAMALREISEQHIVDLDEERKASMVSNLMVVLSGESQVTPVVNTGTLYT